MNSSTSSSDRVDTAKPNRRERGIYLRILLVILAGMTVSMGLVRLFTHLHDASADTILARVMEARAALPKIVQEPDDLVLFFGSSMTEAGIATRQFDRELADKGIAVKSFNFGFGGLNPYFQDFLSRRIVDAFEQENRRLKLAVIEFNPFQTTQTRWQGAKSAEDSFITMLASDRELWSFLAGDITRGIRLLNIRYLRNRISAEMTTNYFGGIFAPSGEAPEPAQDALIVELRERLSAELNRRFEEDYPNYTPSSWSYEWQGAGTIPAERSEETVQLIDNYYATLRTEHRLKGDLQHRIDSADILDLNFEEKLVVSFIQIVKNMQQIADRVEVILLPKNIAWVKNPADALQRQQRVLERIQRETGVTIRDFQESTAITPMMYSDVTHLARYSGDVAFTRMLVDTYADALR